METTTERVFSEALNLPMPERAILAEQLISSIDESNDVTIEQAWQLEVQKRLSQIERSEII